MKLSKLLVIFINIIFLIASHPIHASGGITHMLIAKDAIELMHEMPWMSKKYYQSLDGGILISEKLVAEYTENIWKKILKKESLTNLDRKKAMSIKSYG